MSDICPQGISAETLSAWRSNLLSPSQQEQIAGHVGDCSACQRVLARFDRIAQALRTPPLLPSQDAVWLGVHTPIITSRGIMKKSQKTLALAGLSTAAIIVALFVVFFVLIHPQTGTTPPISVTTPATATTPPTATATVNALKTPLPTQGWVTVPELSLAKDLAFSQSEPLTGYACGNSGSNATTPLELRVTHDGGRTWQGPIVTSIPGASCRINVDPANPQDIVLQNFTCWGLCDGIFQSYRSLDGGQTWIQLQLPADDKGDHVSQEVWIGDAVYFSMYVPNAGIGAARPAHSLLVNTSGNTLTPLNESQLFTGVNSSDEISNIWSFNNTLFVALGGCASCPETFAKTSDNGTSWKTVTASVAGLANLVTDTSNALLANAGGQIFKSNDGGSTWQQLPSIPGISSISDYTPDRSTANGTIFYTGATSIWELVPGSTLWENVSPNPPSQFLGLVTFSTDAAGHPILAWGGLSTDKSIPQSGIGYHALKP